jgi:hypothetical protein
LKFLAHAVLIEEENTEPMVPGIAALFQDMISIFHYIKHNLNTLE